MGMGPIADSINRARQAAAEEAKRKELERTRAQRLHPEPAGGPTLQSPSGGPTRGQTIALNQMFNPNTNRIMSSTGGRTYQANPFASQQGRIGPSGSGAIMPRPPNPGITNPGYIPPGKMPPSRIPGGGMTMGGSPGALRTIENTGGTGLPGFGGPMPNATQRPVMMNPQMQQQMARAQALRNPRGGPYR